METQLSKEEERVMRMSANDLSACEIAMTLNKATRTVHVQLESGKRKLGANTIHGAVAKFVLLHMLGITAIIYTIYLLVKLEAPEIITKAIQVFHQ